MRGPIRARDERGAAAVEFAIVASLLFMILFGIIQFGIAFNRYQGLQAASREGARLGSLSQTTHDEIVARVQETVSLIDPLAMEDTGCAGVLAVGKGCIQITASATPAGWNSSKPCNLNSGATITVLSKYRMEVPIPLWASPTVTITGTGVFRCE
jgi:Flp pilus assembly protein TadG